MNNRIKGITFFKEGYGYDAYFANLFVQKKNYSISQFTRQKNDINIYPVIEPGTAVLERSCDSIPTDQEFARSSAYTGDSTNLDISLTSSQNCKSSSPKNPEPIIGEKLSIERAEELIQRVNKGDIFTPEQKFKIVMDILRSFAVNLCPYKAVIKGEFIYGFLSLSTRRLFHKILILTSKFCTSEILREYSRVYNLKYYRKKCISNLDHNFKHMNEFFGQHQNEWHGPKETLSDIQALIYQIRSENLGLENVITVIDDHSSPKPSSTEEKSKGSLLEVSPITKKNAKIESGWYAFSYDQLNDLISQVNEGCVFTQDQNFQILVNISYTLQKIDFKLVLGNKSRTINTIQLSERTFFCNSIILASKFCRPEILSDYSEFCRSQVLSNYALVYGDKLISRLKDEFQVLHDAIDIFIDDWEDSSECLVVICPLLTDCIITSSKSLGIYEKYLRKRDDSMQMIMQLRVENYFKDKVF